MVYHLPVCMCVGVCAMPGAAVAPDGPHALLFFLIHSFIHSLSLLSLSHTYPSSCFSSDLLTYCMAHYHLIDFSGPFCISTLSLLHLLLSNPLHASVCGAGWKPLYPYSLFPGSGQLSRGPVACSRGPMGHRSVLPCPRELTVQGRKGAQIPTPTPRG